MSNLHSFFASQWHHSDRRKIKQIYHFFRNLTRFLVSNSELILQWSVRIKTYMHGSYCKSIKKLLTRIHGFFGKFVQSSRVRQSSKANELGVGNRALWPFTFKTIANYLLFAKCISIFTLKYRFILPFSLWSAQSKLCSALYLGSHSWEMIDETERTEWMWTKSPLYQWHCWIVRWN